MLKQQFASLITVGLCALGTVLALSTAESQRPRPVQTVEKIVERVRTSSTSSVMYTPNGEWRYRESGPGRDLCVHFLGIFNEDRKRLGDDAPTKSAIVCLKFQPEDARHANVEVQYFEWVILAR
jgi:hypothetical protein